MRLLLERAGSRRWEAWRLTACAVACLGALACEPSEVPEAEGGEQVEAVVAWVDGEPLAVEAVLAARRLRGRGGREARVEAAVLDEIARLEARRRGLHEQPQVKTQLRQMRLEGRRREQEILRAALSKQIVGDVEISEAEIRRAYEQDERSYRDRQLRLREWSFESEHQARSALEGTGEAAALDPGEAVEVGPLSFRNPSRRYARAMGRLRIPGERVVIEAEGKWLVVELAEIETDAKLPFEEVRDQLLRRLQRKRAEQLFEQQLRELRASADVRIDRAVLSDEALWRGLR
jgi:hypothetical protein